MQFVNKWCNSIINCQYPLILPYIPDKNLKKSHCPLRDLVKSIVLRFSWGKHISFCEPGDCSVFPHKEFAAYFTLAGSTEHIFFSKLNTA